MRVFFFSSRRRHTRYIGDWSSDVCSSDLHPCSASMPARTRVAVATLFFLGVLGLIVWIGIDPVMSRFETLGRSEERRVGKECRWLWGAACLKIRKDATIAEN